MPKNSTVIRIRPEAYKVRKIMDGGDKLVAVGVTAATLAAATAYVVSTESFQLRLMRWAEALQKHLAKKLDKDLALKNLYDEVMAGDDAAIGGSA